jgi:hypothetical protein
MSKKIFLILAFAFAVALSGEANAQSLGFGPQVGYHKAKDADDGKFMGGVAFRAKLLPALGVEGSINYRREKFNDGALTVRSWPVMATALIYPLPIAYGAIGAGWYNTTFDFDDDIPLLEREDETQQEFGWHFGGGVELPLATSARLAADIRYVFLNYDFEEVPGSDEIDSNFYVITAGLFFGL